MIKPIEVAKQNGNSNSESAGVDELVDRFLKLNDPALKDGFFRGEPFNGTKVKIENRDGKLHIAYGFTETEVAILQTLSEVTSVSVNWLARDAVGWLRSYIADLPTDGTGQVFDLFDEIPSTQRTRAFTETLKRTWRRRVVLPFRPPEMHGLST